MKKEWWDDQKNELISKNDVENMIRVVVPVLENSGIQYWLGRGTLRDLKVMDEVGDKCTDIDFHIWFDDKERLEKALESLRKKLELKVKKDKPYKIAYENRPKYYFEFMFLKNSEDDQDICYHERYNGKRYAPKECFSGYEFYNFKGLKIRIPKKPENYLKCVYGPKWEDRNYEDKDFPNSLEVSREIVKV